MIADVHEPLEQYAAHFKTAHQTNTYEYFEDLVRQSGVDEEANAKTVQQLRYLERQVEGASSKNKWWRVLRVCTYIVAIFTLGYFFIHYSWPWLIVPTIIVSFAIYRLNEAIKNSNVRLENFKLECNTKQAEAWGQMAALNRLFNWDILSKLIQKTVPRIELDPYFSNGRMFELLNNFGWSSELGENHSIIFSHSGVLNGNPFVLGRTLTHWMGTKTYHGSLAISWTEQVRDSDGKWTTKTLSLIHI